MLPPPMMRGRVQGPEEHSAKQITIELAEGHCKPFCAPWRDTVRPNPRAIRAL